MEKFIEKSKMSKKAQKALNNRDRGSWGGVKPYTVTFATDKPKHPTRAMNKRALQKEMW